MNIYLILYGLMGLQILTYVTHILYVVFANLRFSAENVG